MNPRKIFISHSTADLDWARSFARALREAGADIWFDEFDIKPGDPISESVEAGLRQSDTVVLLITDESAQSYNFFFELGAALGMNKKIIPIVPEDFAASKLPLSLRRRKYLIRKAPEKTAKELAVGLELLQGEAA